MVEVDVAADAVDLLTDAVAAVVMVVALADIVFDNDYIVVSVNFDFAVVAGLAIAFVVVAVDDGGVPAFAHGEA